MWQNFFNTFCFYSSQIQPASEQGLLALSAIGLLASDTRLAALALSELVKVGQGGTFTFFFNSCVPSSEKYLYSLKS